MSKIAPEITIIVSQDDSPVRGNFATGDDKLDQEFEDQILAELESGNVWAWCTVEVKAELRGLEASDYLGGCSYKNFEDFKAGGYFEDMVKTACAELESKIEDLQGVKLDPASTVSHKVLYSYR